MPIGRIRQDKGKRVDRQSNLGNPFPITRTQDRDKVCEAYQKYFDLVVNKKFEPWQAIKIVERQLNVTGNAYGHNPPLRANFMLSLAHLRAGDCLLCHCHPQRCHASTIEDYLRQRSGLLAAVSKEESDGENYR